MTILKNCNAMQIENNDNKLSNKNFGKIMTILNKYLRFGYKKIIQKELYSDILKYSFFSFLMIFF